MPTADQTRNGGGIGSTIEVSRHTLSPAVRSQLAADPLIKMPPRYAKKVKWLVAPTAGEGRTGGSVNYVSAGTEDWVDFVAPTQGQTVTTMICMWVPSGTLDFYMYASQWTGLTGVSGYSGSYFSGTSAGIDNSNYLQEVLHRSHKMTATTTPQCFQYTFNFLDMQTIAPDNGLIIGAGFDFQDLGVGTEIYLTAVDFQIGATLVPWEPTPDDLAQQLAKSRYQSWGPGVMGFTLSATSMLLHLPYSGAFNPTKPLTVYSGPNSYPSPSIAALMMIDKAPVFQVGVNSAGCPTCGAKTGSNSNITSQQFGPGGGYVVINGFTGLPTGIPVISGKPNAIIQAEYW